jgi:hypothetical protein
MQITDAIGTSLGTGLANTEAIVVIQGEGTYVPKFVMTWYTKGLMTGFYQVRMS